MPQSHASIHVHLVFSTKDRRPLLNESIRSDLHAYMATILKNLDCPAIILNSVEDHIHVLFRLSRTLTLAKIVEVVKKTTSRWIKNQAPELTDFSWQAGYGAFSVSSSQIDTMRRYIEQQREHHLKRTFQDELRQALKRHGLEFDERYLWD